jgi:YHS domain-containing protein
MAANNALIVTDINFDQIKGNLQAFLSSQTQFKDYDFEASGMQTILHLLAYNTYYNSIYTNMVANEMFLDSALIRNNVVSRAKMLGFTPGSARGARADLRLQFQPVGTPASITVPANTQFTSSADGITYTFSTEASKTALPDGNTNYITTVTVREGNPVQESYTVNSNAPVRYLLNNEDCDTETLSVNVQQSISNTSSENYVLASAITGVTGNSAVYYLQENNDGAFEVLFGDNILGKRLIDGNIVKLNYKVCNGTAPNGINKFTGPSTIGGYSYTTSVVSRATGGAGPQSIESIKFNAPRSYTAQNRAVTANDYKNLLLNKARDLQAVSVWGGEDNSPPIYGKVYVCAKPIGANILTDLRKQELVNLLNEFNVLTLEPVFVDATFLYIVPTINVTYNSNFTAKSPNRLISLVDTELGLFQDNELSSFNQTFYDYRVSNALAKLDDSIVAVTVASKMQKRFIPVTGNVLTSYTLNFNNPMFNPHPGHRYTVSSTGFTHQGVTCYFDDNGSGVLRIYRLQGGNRVYLNRNAGTVDYDSGTIDIFSLRISGYQFDSIRVSATPRRENINTVRNQILLLADAFVSITDTKTKRIVASTTSTLSTTQATSPSDVGLNQSSYVY